LKKTLGEPDAGNPQVRFDEGALETDLWTVSTWHEAGNGGYRQDLPTGTAPAPHSTGLILHDDFRLSEQPFALGLRFLGDRLSADVGVILVGELIDEGFPVPWLSVSYHFGNKK
jgi:hypothetical protein